VAYKPQLCQLRTEARLGFSVGVLREVSITPSVSTPDVGQLSRLLYCRKKGAASSVVQCHNLGFNFLTSQLQSPLKITLFFFFSLNSTLLKVFFSVLAFHAGDG